MKFNGAYEIAAITQLDEREEDTSRAFSQLLMQPKEDKETPGTEEADNVEPTNV